MCAAFEFKGVIAKPGREIVASGTDGPLRHVWAGFAREEILSWWESKGARLIDIPASRFAERSGITGKLLWADVPDGRVIRGIVDLKNPGPLIKIVTRESSPAELERFQHPRMPVLEAPLFAPLPEGFGPRSDDPDLFG